jgi:hypothetical protein
MSGTLPQYRPGNKPLFIGGIAVPKYDKYDRPVMRYVLKPGGTYVNGRCTDYQVLDYQAQVHVLDYRPQEHRPSKHSGGRTFARDARQRRHAANQRARLVQAVKSQTIDMNLYYRHMSATG